MRRIIILQLIILLAIISSCKKDHEITEPVNTNPINNVDPDFIFFPTNNACWIINSIYTIPMGSYTFYDTLFLGKDTIMQSRTKDPKSQDFSNAGSLSLKSYKEIIISTLQITTQPDTFNYPRCRYGWFRQDVTGKKIYIPRINSTDNIIYDYLVQNFSLNMNDTTDFTWPDTYGSYIVKEVDSIMFGNKYLKQIRYGTPNTPYIKGEIIQAVNVRAYNIYQQGGSQHPGSIQWIKFIYKGDTLLTQY
jgi:hypothetical protein